MSDTLTHAQWTALRAISVHGDAVFSTNRLVLDALTMKGLLGMVKQEKYRTPRWFLTQKGQALLAEQTTAP